MPNTIAVVPNCSYCLHYLEINVRTKAWLKEKRDKMIKLVLTSVFLVLSFVGSDAFGQCTQIKRPCWVRMCQCFQRTTSTIPLVPPNLDVCSLPQTTSSLPQTTSNISLVTPVYFTNFRGQRTLAINDSTSHNLLYRITNSGSGYFFVRYDREPQIRLAAVASIDITFSFRLTLQTYSGGPSATGSYELLRMVPR